MGRICNPLLWFVCCVLLVVPTAWGQQAVRSDRLLPNTTRGYISITDAQTLSDHWDQTQLGQLMKDPVMEPFAKDLRRQFENRLSRIRDRLGLKLDDLKGVPGGEVSVSLVQPDKMQAAVVLLVDVTGHQNEAEAMLEKVAVNFAKQDAKKDQRQIGETTVIIFDLPETSMEPAQRVVYFLSGNLLGGADNLAVIEGILRHMVGQGKAGATLSDVPAYQAVMARCRQHTGASVPQIRWFIEPLGYIEAVRAATPEQDRRKGKTVLEVFKNQGFTAVRGVGGFVDFKSGGYELLHRTAVFAPPPYPSAPPPYKKKVSMQMLDFPNSSQFAPLPWIPNDIATCTTLYWDILKAFDNFDPIFDEMVGGEDLLFEMKTEFEKDLVAGTLSKEFRKLFDAEGAPLAEQVRILPHEKGRLWRILGGKETYLVRKTPEKLKVYVLNVGVWEDVLRGLREDSNGPQMDLRSELFVHLGKRVTVLGDYELPITTSSERLLFAIEAVNDKAVAKGIEKWLKDDPTIRRREFEGHVIWETVEEQGPQPPKAPPLVDIPSLKPKSEPPKVRVPLRDELRGDEKESQPLLPHASITVAHGHLLIGSHYDFLTTILHKANGGEPLGNSIDFKVVQAEMKKLGAEVNCVRSFSRTDEEYRPTYEMIRMGKMPESEALLGRLLNALLRPQKKGQIRKPKLDGQELPDYQVVRRYLGPAGLFGTSEENGWFVVGFTLKK